MRDISLVPIIYSLKRNIIKKIIGVIKAVITIFLDRSRSSVQNSMQLLLFLHAISKDFKKLKSNMNPFVIIIFILLKRGQLSLSP